MIVFNSENYRKEKDKGYSVLPLYDIISREKEEPKNLGTQNENKKNSHKTKSKSY